MGLDIFFERATKTRERESGEHIVDYYDDLYGAYKEAKAEEAKKVLSQYALKIRKEKANKFPALKKELIAELQKLFEYEFEYERFTKAENKTEFLTKLGEFYEKFDWTWFIPPYAAYFRKVNCIYEFFSDKLEDEMCIATKEDILDLVSRAKTVLKEHNNEIASELLPTRSGFFFGSTEYDEWYYSDLEDIVKTFEKVLETWNDNEIIFVCMDW